MHDPSADPWRKGAIEVEKAPRGKENARGPDTFGLYNPDGPVTSGAGRRPLASTSVNAPSASHALALHTKDKEISRLTASLAASQSSLSTITAQLSTTTASLSAAQRDLRRAEGKSTGLEDKLARLEKRLEGVKALQSSFEGLRAEHEKSKVAREKDIARLQETVVEKEDAIDGLESELAQTQRRHSALEADACSALRSQVNSANRFFDEVHDPTVLEQKLRILRSDRKLAERAAQVTELVEVISQLEDQLAFATAQNRTLKHDAREGWRQLRCAEDAHAIVIKEHDAALEFASSTSSATLRSVLKRLASFEQELGLSKERESIADEVRVALVEERDGLVTVLEEASCTNSTLAETVKSLRGEISNLENQVSSLSGQLSSLQAAHNWTTSQLEVMTQEHADAKGAWEAERDGLKSDIREKDKELEKEAEAKKRLGKALGVSRQAENALKEELTEAQAFESQLETLKAQHSTLLLSHAKLSVLTQSNVERADVLSELNASLVSHANSQQKVKVLDRLRQEGKVERETIATLESKLVESRREVEQLRGELAAYQSVGGGTTGATLSRVQRPAPIILDGFEDVPQSVHALDLARSDPRDDDTVRLSLGGSGSHITGPRASRVPRASLAGRTWAGGATSRGAGRPSMAVVEEVIGEESLGAVRMDGLMTLDELR